MGTERQREEPCPFCASRNVLARSQLGPVTRWAVECFECGARGPTAATEVEAVARWNTMRGRIFGHTRIVIAKGGIATDTLRVAERLRTIAEAMEGGQYGSVDGAVVALRMGVHATAIAIRLPPGDTAATLRAVLDSATVQAKIKPPSKG